MIWAFLTERGVARLRKGWWLLIAALGCIALYLAITGLLDRLESSAETRGATVQRESNLAETIDRVERANEAEVRIERDADARRAGCLRHSRTPENC